MVFFLIYHRFWFV